MKIGDYSVQMHAQSSLEEHKEVNVSYQRNTEAQANSFQTMLDRMLTTLPPSNKESAITEVDRLQELRLQFIQAFMNLLYGDVPKQAGMPGCDQEAKPPVLGRESTSRQAVTFESTYSCKQSMQFQAQGIVRTADGQEVSFDLNYAMSYEMSMTQSMSMLHERLTDPIIMNYDGPASELEALGDSLDLDLDGSIDRLPFPKAGSGYLVLDKNGNGQIDDGTEMFGPKSGKGFSELARYDSDHNGWIDENDPIFQELQVWHQDEVGEKHLSSLKDLKIGAIHLGSEAVGYRQYGEGHELLGQIKRAGFLLKEDGTPRLVQEVDVKLK